MASGKRYKGGTTIQGVVATVVNTMITYILDLFLMFLVVCIFWNIPFGGMIIFVVIILSNWIGLSGTILFTSPILL